MVWPFRRRSKKKAVDDARVTTANWDTQDCKIVVSEEPGYLCKVAVRAKLDCPPQEVFHMLVDPENARFLRSIKAVTYRKVSGCTCVIVCMELYWQSLWKYRTITGGIYGLEGCGCFLEIGG